MTRAKALKKRRATLKKKAQELSTLCGIDVAYICFDRNGSLDTWPEDKNKVKDIVLKYMKVKSREKKSSTPAAAAAAGSSSEAIVNGGSQEVDAELGDWKSRLDELSEEELVKVYKSVEEKLERLTGRIASLEEEKGGIGENRRVINLDLETLTVQASVDLKKNQNRESEETGDGLSRSRVGEVQSWPTWLITATGITPESR